MKTSKKNTRIRVPAALMAVLPLAASAQIYRCDTPDGPVFTDQKCSEEARVVKLEDDSQGLGGGPSDEVREYLDQKRQERAEERAKAARFTPSPTQPGVQAPQPAENAVLLPGYLRPIRPGRPVVKPRPRPLPERPNPPDNDSGGTPSVIRPGSGQRD